MFWGSLSLGGFHMVHFRNHFSVKFCSALLIIAVTGSGSSLPYAWADSSSDSSGCGSFGFSGQNGMSCQQGQVAISTTSAAQKYGIKPLSPDDMQNDNYCKQSSSYPYFGRYKNTSTPACVEVCQYWNADMEGTGFNQNSDEDASNPLPVRLNSNAYCNDAYLSEISANYELAASIIYGTATVACGISCAVQMSVSPDLVTRAFWETLCIDTALAGLGVDLTGTIEVTAKGQNSTKGLMDNAATVFGPVMASVGGGVLASFAGGIGGEAVKKALGEISCVTTLASAYMAFSRISSAKKFQQGADVDRRNAIGMLPISNLPPIMAPNMQAASGQQGSAGANGAISVAGGIVANMAKPGSKVASPLTVAQITNADTAAFAPLSQIGKSPNDILANMDKTGGDPIKAALAALQDQIPSGMSADQVASIGNMMDTGKQLADGMTDDQKKLLAANTKPLMQNPNPPPTYASASSGGGNRAPAKAAGLDIQGLMAQFMPGGQKKEEKGPQGPQGINFSSTTGATAGQVSSEGFYSPASSLFDVVGKRYQSLSQRFLQGQVLVPEGSPSLVPKNLYLGK